MVKVSLNVSLNKRQTKYLTPGGKEVPRTWSIKKILGDQWSKYNIGVYKGRDDSFRLIKDNQELLESQELFKKIFNKNVKDKKEDALEKGTLLHKEIEIALKQENYIEHLKMIVELNKDEETLQNPFALMYLDFFKVNPELEILGVETSFTYEGDMVSFGGTLDTLLCSRDEEGNIIQIINIDNKTSAKTKAERYDDLYLDYGMQQAIYREAICAYYGIEKEQYRSLIFFDDGEVFKNTSNYLTDLYNLFLLGVHYNNTLSRIYDYTKDLREGQ